MSDNYGGYSRPPYQRGGGGGSHSNYGAQHQNNPQFGSNYNSYNQGRGGGRGAPGFHTHGRGAGGAGRGWNNSPNSYNDRGNFNNPQPPQHYQQSPQQPIPSFYQQHHPSPRGNEPWSNRGAPRHTNTDNFNYSGGHSPNIERTRYNSSETSNRLSEDRQNFDGRKSQITNSDESGRKASDNVEAFKSRRESDNHGSSRSSNSDEQRHSQSSDIKRTRRTSNSDDRRHGQTSNLDKHRQRQTSNSDEHRQCRTSNSNERLRQTSNSEDHRTSRLSSKDELPENSLSSNYDDSRKSRSTDEPRNKTSPISYSRLSLEDRRQKTYTSTPVDSKSEDLKSMISPTTPASKRRLSSKSYEDTTPVKDHMEDAKTESDSDALVIDMDDGESEKKLKSNIVKSEEVQSEKPKSSQAMSEERVKHVKEPVEVVPEKPKVRKRKRKIASDQSSHTDEDDNDIAQIEEKQRPPPMKRGNLGKDFKIPKKKPVELLPNLVLTGSTAVSNPLSSPLRTEKKFELVEDALEAMFADLSGEADEPTPVIVKTEDIKDELTSKAPIKEAVKAPAKEIIKAKETLKAASKATPPAKKKAPAKKGKQESKPSFNSPSINGNARINKKKKVATTQQEILLQKYRGPFVRVEGDPTSPFWTQIVNSSCDPLSYEEERTMEKPDIELKVRASGFGSQSHSTTLSCKYDAKKPDESWNCVFCKRPSHYQGLGDLFGPYFVSKDVISSVQHRSPSKKQDLAAKFIIGGADKKQKRRKNASGDHTTSQDIASPVQQYQNQMNNPAFGSEVWFHEDCVCWLSSIKIVGHSLLGLDEAIKQSHSELCAKCHLTGCTLGCVENGCRETAHFLCARQSAWAVDPESFQALCSKHSKL